MIILLQLDLSFSRSAVLHFSRLHFRVIKKFTNVRSMFAGMFKQSAQLNQISLVSSAPSFICSLCQFGHTSLCTCHKLLGSHSCKASTTQQMESQPTEITFLLCSTQKKSTKELKQCRHKESAASQCLGTRQMRHVQWWPVSSLLRIFLRAFLCMFPWAGIVGTAFHFRRRRPSALPVSNWLSSKWSC